MYFICLRLYPELLLLLLLFHRLLLEHISPLYLSLSFFVYLFFLALNGVYFPTAQNEWCVHINVMHLHSTRFEKL